MKLTSLGLLFVMISSSVAFAQINYQISSGTLKVSPYSVIPPASSLLPSSFTTTATSLTGCVTEDISDDDFYAQPWIGDDQYLTNFLTTMNLPPAPGPQARVADIEDAVKYRIKVKFWEYRNSAAVAAMPLWQYQRYMDALNRAHRTANTGIRFYMIDEITYINDPSLTTMHATDGFSNWLSGRNQAFALNVHVVDDVYGAGGRTVLGPSRAVMVEKYLASSNNVSSFVHEVGHFLGLIHTHFGSKYRGPTELCWVEPVDHSRRFSIPTLCHGFAASGKRKCAYAGDGLCDTPADPDMDVSQVSSCAFIDGSKTDIYGDNYLSPPSGSSSPDPTNIMSYGNHSCRTNFTQEQVGVMLHSIHSLLGGNHSNEDTWADSGVQFDSYEPDMSIDMARPIGITHDPQVHSFHRAIPGGAAADVDWMYFEVTAPESGKSFTIKTQHGSVYLDDANTKITLYNATVSSGFASLGAQIATNSSYNGTAFARLSANLTTGFYAIKVENESWIFSPGSYLISVFNCADPDEFYVTGDSNICNSGSFTFTANGVPPGVSIIWTVSSTVQILGTSGNTISVRGNSLGSSGWVKASICSIEQNAQKDFSIGVVSNSDLDVDGSDTACSNSTVTYRAEQAPIGYTYSWSYPTANGWSYSSGQGSINLTLTSGTTDGAITYHLVGACGNSTPAPNFITHITCTGGGGGHFLIAAYPNPADTELTVTLPEDSANLIVDESKWTPRKPTRSGHEVVVYDILQREVFRTRTDGTTVNIPTHQLPEGVYYLNIINREGVSQRQIEIRRR
jgi:hypothetical protein